jgi:thiaminase/transcriptional activator TenA
VLDFENMSGVLSISEKLWRGNQPRVQTCLDHPFVVGMAAGTLSESAYKKYLAQDILFLCGYLSACLSSAHDLEDPEFKDFLIQAVHLTLDELQSKQDEARTRDIASAYFAPTGATCAFCDLLVRAAATRKMEILVASTTPCVRLYAEIGSKVNPAPKSPYVQWFEKYCSPGMIAASMKWEQMLNRIGIDSPDVRRAYSEALQHEVAFFDAALE